MNVSQNIKNAVFLAQCDTTAGFLSANQARILEVKNSPKDKAILRESCDLAHIKALSRIPRILRKRIRFAKKTTFIFDNNLSFRVVGESSEKMYLRGEWGKSKKSRELGGESHESTPNLHHAFLKRFGTLFSSSANQKGKKFEKNFALNRADIIVSDNRGFFEDLPSSIFCVKKSKIRKFR